MVYKLRFIIRLGGKFWRYKKLVEIDSSSEFKYHLKAEDEEYEEIGIRLSSCQGHIPLLMDSICG